MNTDASFPRHRSCDAPERQILDFYLNGSLEAPEEEEVRLHLDACATCAAELDTMTQIVRGLERHAIHPVSPVARRWPGRWALGLAACVIAVAAVALSTLALLNPGSRPDPARQPVVIGIDLGAGAMRGDGSTSAVEIPRAADTIRISLFPPIEPDANYMAFLARDDRPVTPETALGPVDPMGRAVVEFAATTIEVSGVYELRMRVTGPDGAARIYRYPFEIRRTGDGR